jgi:transposase
MASADDIDALKAELAATQARVAQVEAELVLARADAANAKAHLSVTRAMIEHLKLEIAKAKREMFGQTSERSARLIDQMELELE